MIAMRIGDRYDDPNVYIQQPPGPGVFEPIAATPPVDPKLAFVRPFTHASPSDYRPGPPIELTSKHYAEDVAELQAYGRIDSTVRSTLQTQTVLFHTEQTYQQFNRTLRELALARGLDLRESARMLGYVNVATADTMLACWEAKYHYNFWRPNHAIQRADTDGNPDTVKDATWLPLVVGNHPEYPSGHACFTGAVTESLRQYFGTKRSSFVITSLAPGAGPTRTFNTLDERVKDVENARVWAVSLPLDDDRDGQGLPADRPRRRQALLPAARRRRRGHPRRRLAAKSGEPRNNGGGPCRAARPSLVAPSDPRSSALGGHPVCRLNGAPLVRRHCVRSAASAAAMRALLPAVSSSTTICSAAAIGTPMIAPINPKSAPNASTLASTVKPEILAALPMIVGCRM